MYSQYQTTSIQRKSVLTFFIFPRDQFHACRNISLGSQILAVSHSGQITKWTEAWAVEEDRYLTLLSKVHQAVWWIIIPLQLLVHFDFLFVEIFFIEWIHSILYWNKCIECL